MEVEACFVRRRAVSLLAGGLVLIAAAGCHRPPAADVMATVNGKEIMREDVEKYYKASIGDSPQPSDSPQQPSQEQSNIVHLNILHQLIDDEILQQQASKLNLAATEEDVTAKLTEMKAPYTQEEFDRQLKQRNLTLDDLRRDLRRSLTQQKLLNKEIESKINITDSDISNYYMAHKSEFNLIEPQYHVAQIVASSSQVQQSRGAGDGDAKKRIQNLYNRLRSGEDFGAVASQYSDNPNNASNGGDMGFVNESALRSDPEAYASITRLKPGEISEPVPAYDGGGAARRVDGFAIYKLLAREPAGQRAINDPRVQQTIRQFLRESHAQLLKNAYLEILHNEAKVRNYYAEQILKSGGQ